jgi:uncharacterized OB-fold protein
MQRVIAFQRCASCAAAVHPPRPACPVCGSTRLDDARSEGRGVVYATTTVHRREGAHDVSLIDLEEGFRVMGEVVDVAPDEVRIGAAVLALERDERVVFTGG